MGYSVSHRTRQEAEERLVANLRKSLPVLQAACNWDTIYRECRDRAARTDVPGYAARMAELAKLEAEAARWHAAIAGRSARLPARAAFSPVHHALVQSYQQKLVAATWKRMQRKLLRTDDGRACLDHIRKMLDAKGTMLEAAVPLRMYALLSNTGPTPPRPPITVQDLSSVGIKLLV
jgi:hypothetical protein